MSETQKGNEKREQEAIFVNNEEQTGQHEESNQQYGIAPGLNRTMSITLTKEQFSDLYLREWGRRKHFRVR